MVRLPKDTDDPACALPRIDEYLRGLKALDAADGMAKEAVFDSRSSMWVLIWISSFGLVVLMLGQVRGRSGRRDDGCLPGLL